MNKTLGVFIGRFAPLHNGHLEVIKYGEANFNEFLVIVGSSEQSKRLSNPFTLSERCQMVTNVVELNTGILEARDYPYNNDEWVEQIRDLIEYEPIKEVTLISGREEWYFKLFPEYKKVVVPMMNPTLSSTYVREQLYRKLGIPNQHLPDSTIRFLNTMGKGRVDQLWEEYRICVEAKAEYPHPTIATDAMVTCGGNIVLVTRGNYPGKGQLALPGGFLEPDLWLEENAVKELKEETGINMWHRHKASRVFDWPKRSSRSRTVTHVFHYEISGLWKVEGGDDAAKADWYRIDELQPTNMFEDHYHIIEEMLG